MDMDTATLRIEARPSAAIGHSILWVYVNGKLVCAYAEYALRTCPADATVSDRWLLAALGENDKAA